MYHPRIQTWGRRLGRKLQILKFHKIANIIKWDWLGIWQTQHTCTILHTHTYPYSSLAAVTTRCQYCFNTSSFIFSTVSCYDTHSESFSIHSISSHQLIILYFQLSFVKQLSNKKHTWRNKMTPYTDHGDTTRLIDCIASKSSSMLVLHLAIVFQHVKQIGQIARCRVNKEGQQ